MDNERPSPPEPPFLLPGLERSPFEVYTSFPRRQKFKHRYRTHIVLFLLTLFTTSFAPVFFDLWNFIFSGANPLPVFTLFTWSRFVEGLPRAIPLLTILTAHEFGHYFACRYYNVDATLPYYLPAPVPLTGTFGAVIRIREPIPSKRALFDIGIAGPIAGFVALVPFLFWGVSLSTLGTVHAGEGIELGEPLLFKLVAWLHFGPIPAGSEVILHPIGFAAWFGMLATALNLMPFGQLDGGHISYAVLGRRSAYVSLATLATALVLTVITRAWILTTIMMFLMAYFLGVRHPPVPDEHAPLDVPRRFVAAFGLLMFIGCFMPIPVIG